MYANVVVLTYQSPDIDSYTYEIPKILQSRIKVGQLVSVPFGKRNPIGLVISTVNQKSTTIGNIKPIISIISTNPILLPFQIELLKWLSSYYHAPMVNCLKALLPPTPKRLYEAQQTVYRPQSITQTLVIVPNINSIPQALAKFKQAKNYAIYHSELKNSEKFEVWQKIISGNADYVFGSRLSIFAPCPKLSKIIIYDEHEGAYKDERSPYFDTLTVAEKISELTKCKLQIIDSSPKITTYFNHRQNIQIPKISTKVQIVSMLTEKAAGNSSPISDILETYIKRGSEKNKKILLFLNKKSDSGHVYCRNCKYSEFANTRPETCPECHSTEIFFNSLNVKSLAILVQKIVPEAKINLLSENRLQSTVYSLPSIDIATAAVFYKLSPKKYDLAAHIRTDSALNINDFTSQEKLFAQITNLKKLAKGLVLLQTYNPEHLVLQTVTKNNYLDFYNKHLEERKMLSYPPFSLLIKLSIKGKIEDLTEAKAQKLYEKLSLQSAVYGLQSTSLGPYKSHFTKRNLKYNIILKVKINDYSLATRENAIKNLKPVLEKVPRDVQITQEPSNLS